MTDPHKLLGHLTRGSNDEEALAAVRAKLDVVTSGAVACGIVVSAWRDPMEELHRQLSDHEMAYINISTTAAVLPHCAPDEVEWSAVTAVLRDPERELLPARSAKDVAGRQWKQLEAEITSQLRDIEQRPPRFLGMWASMTCPEWWGMPDYPHRWRASSPAGASPDGPALTPSSPTPC